MKIALAIVFFALSIFFLSRRKIIASRVKATERLLNLEGGKVKKEHILFRLVRSAVEKLGNLEHAKKMRKLLEDSGLAISWYSFRILWLALFIILPSIAFILTKNILVTIPAIFITFELPKIVLKMLAQKEERKREEECEEIACELSLYLRCGIPVEDAVILSTKLASPSISKCIEGFSSRVSLGLRGEVALLELARELGAQDMELVAYAVMVSRETGADIRELMGALGEAIRERTRIRRELETQTVQARLSGKVVASLPFLFLAITAGISREALSMLFLTPQGLLMLGISIVLDLTGLVWMKKILDIKME